MLQPFRGWTWAPSGQTPIQHAWDRRDRLSAMVALSLSPCRRHIGLYYQLQRGNIHGPDAAAFLRATHHHLQRKLILVVDRYSVHRSAIGELWETKSPWLRVEWLPPYAPELDPVEAVWNHTKCVDLANFVPNNLDDLEEAVIDSLTKQAANPSLKRSYFHFAGLEL
jgi:transposase